MVVGRVTIHRNYCILFEVFTHKPRYLHRILARIGQYTHTHTHTHEEEEFYQKKETGTTTENEMYTFNYCHSIRVLCTT